MFGCLVLLGIQSRLHRPEARDALCSGLKKEFEQSNHEQRLLGFSEIEPDVADVDVGGLSGDSAEPKTLQGWTT